MILSQSAYTVYQIIIFVWFCVGISIVGFFAIRDLFKMFGKNNRKKDSEQESISG
ncbi:MAG: hypothetical protein LUD01_09285 [Clostridiales bacterium]|nr:hypothetical protein [Clostridiales bacterium]